MTSENIRRIIEACDTTDYEHSYKYKRAALDELAALEQERDRLKATVADCGKLREDIKYGRRHHGIRLDEIDRKLGDIIARAAIADEPKGDPDDE